MVRPAAKLVSGDAAARTPSPRRARQVPTSEALARLTLAWLIALLAGGCAQGDGLEAGYAAEKLRRLSAAMPGRMVAFRPGAPPVVLAAEAAHAAAV